MCENCKAEMLELLDKRIRRILEVAHADNPAACDDNPEIQTAQAECFHLMEIQNIVRGERTCGVYDEHGPAPTISGPLFPEVT